MPHWPTDRQRRQSPTPPPPDAPFVLTEVSANALRISAANVAALELGLAPGMPLADARALTPDLAHAERAFPDERADLERLARWCARYSPFVAPVGEAFGASGLMFDITGVAHLFGDEPALAAAMAAGIRGLGLAASVAIADTPGLAAALAGFDPRAKAGYVAPVGAGLPAIAHLPTACLRLPKDMDAALRAVGLKRVGDLERIARASLARRFGAELIARLDQASGAQGEPVDPIAPATPIFALRKLLEPLVTLDPLARVAGDLCADLALRLDAAGVGARAVRLDLFRVDGEAASVTVGFAQPERDAARLRRIVVERMERGLEGVDLGFGVEAAMLVATSTPRVIAQAVDLDPEAARRADAARSFASLSDTLVARLGDEAIFSVAGRDSHLPERAQTRRAGSAISARADRPLFLLARPEPIEALAEIPDGPPRSFRWRRLSFRVARAEGPERIGDEWWRAVAPSRDYFRVETVEGRRLWLFREGLYGRETDRPRWFVHGSFA